MRKKSKGKRGGMIRFSREQGYNMGLDYCDTSIYTVKAPRAARRKLGKPSRPCQENLNERNAKLRFKRIIEANMTEGKDVCVLLTFDETHRPETRAEAKKHMVNFIRRLRRAWETMELPCKPCGLYVIEGGDGKRIHIHAVMRGGMPASELKELWGMAGIVNVDILQPNRNGLEALSRYLEKQGKLSDGEHRWYRFGELVEPDVEEMNGKMPLDEVAELGRYIQDEMEAGADTIPTSERYAPIESRYSGYFCSEAEAKYLEQFGEWVVHIKLYRKDTPIGVQEQKRRRLEEREIARRKAEAAWLGL